MYIHDLDYKNLTTINIKLNGYDNKTIAVYVSHILILNLLQYVILIYWIVMFVELQ